MLSSEDACPYLREAWSELIDFQEELHILILNRAKDGLSNGRRRGAFGSISRKLKRGWGTFFREGTNLVNHTPQDKEEVFRERAGKVLTDPGGMGLF